MGVVVHQVTLDKEERGARLVLLAPLESQENKDQLVHQVSVDLLALWDPLV